MKKPVLINSVVLYIINKVKIIRTSLGLTTREIHKILDLSDDGNILGVIESNYKPNKYNDKHLNKLAIAFTEKSFELGHNISYTVADFYPPADFEEKMVEKIVVKIAPTELRQTGVLQLLVVEENDPFFDDWHTSREIAEHCGAKANKPWSSSDFTSVIESAVRKGILIRKSEQEALYKKP